MVEPADTQAGSVRGPTKVVLSKEVSQDALDDAMASLSLRLTNVIPATPQLPAQLIYSAPPDRQLYVIEDSRLGVLYVAAGGPEAEELVASLCGHVDCITDATHQATALLTAADPADAEVLRPLLAALVLSHPDTAETNNTLRRALKYDDVDVRDAALTALTYAPTRALYGALATVRDGDASADHKDRAAQILAAIVGGS